MSDFLDFEFRHNFNEHFPWLKLALLIYENSTFKIDA